ncbi:hypothetical protein ACFL0V_02345, partial [Nanoarchaeota archaeon]
GSGMIYIWVLGFALLFFVPLASIIFKFGRQARAISPERAQAVRSLLAKMLTELRFIVPKGHVYKDLKTITKFYNKHRHPRGGGLHHFPPFPSPEEFQDLLDEVEDDIERKSFREHHVSHIGQETLRLTAQTLKGYERMDPLLKVHPVPHSFSFCLFHEGMSKGPIMPKHRAEPVLNHIRQSIPHLQHLKTLAEQYKQIES